MSRRTQRESNRSINRDSWFLLISGLFILLAGALAALLWYRKRNLRTVEMIRADTMPAAQPNNSNQV